jgi:hypothetical protein
MAAVLISVWRSAILLLHGAAVIVFGITPVVVSLLPQLPDHRYRLVDDGHFARVSPRWWYRASCRALADPTLIVTSCRPKGRSSNRAKPAAGCDSPALLARPAR